MTMKRKRIRLAVIHIRCTPAEKKAITAAAKAERRSLTSYLVNVAIPRTT